jgi:hypothetical protein
MATPERGSREPNARTRGRIDSGAPRRDAPGSESERQAQRSPDEAPQSPRRNYRLAIVMALIVFALLIGVRVLWGGLGDRPPALPPTETTQGTTAPAN